MRNKISKIVWQDIYIENNTTIDNVISNLGKIHIVISYGRKIYENKQFIVLVQNDSKDIPNNDFIIIPKGCIIKMEVV